MADFLLELLSEEVPARMQARARADLAKMFADLLAGSGLQTGPIEVFSTPRRLVLIARDVAAETQAAREEIKGPKTAAPAQALDGFLRKTGLTRDQLEERDGILFAVIERPGRPASGVIGEALGRIIADFPWPKSMRWGSGEMRWVRPLQGIVAMLGEEIVPITVGDVTSGATTVGHRFHHPGPITIGGASDYAEKLRACHVIVDQDERERIIRDGAEQAASEAGLRLHADEGLVVENAGLTEWPVPLLGQFDAEYLDVPREVIVLTMRTNQKYFACVDDGGQLAPAFVCVANIDANDSGEAIVEGNRRVLAARLSDARFFWQQDLKVPLEEQAKKLSGIVFHDKLGTVADKVERVAKLASWFCEEGVVPPPEHMSKEELAHAARTATGLCKADLVTGLVGEFPELQGIVGGHIAHCQGHSQDVSNAIRDHYKPVGQGDDVPTAPVTVAVALADKLDSLRSFFAVGETPTGSRDPFALRRAALGTIQLIVANNLRMPAAEGDLLDFFADRLKVQQRAAGVRHDLIDAVFALGGEDDLVRLLARVKALQGFVETDEGMDLLAGYKRASNILKKEQWDGSSAAVSPADMEAQEQALIEALDAAEPKATKAIEAEDFTAAMAALASLRAPIDTFFDKVTVNDPDPAKRERRLDLLLRFRDAVHRVADFSKIEG
jgi:glycyl-tRNA synthetase beta chain